MATQQSQDLTLCDIDPDLLVRFKKFRFRRAENKAALILKIDPKTRLIQVDDEVEDQDISEIAEDLPDQVPRFIIYTFTHQHAGGRKSVPLVFIYLSPQGAKTELQMMYAGSKTNLVAKLEISKIFEVRTASDLTQEWINEKMKFFDVNP